MIATRKEFSAGGVVYKKDNQGVRVILIAKKGKAIWSLPKGKIEEDETLEIAAQREIKEETGAEAELIRLLGDIKYQYISPVDKARVFKKVRFFLFKYKSGDVSHCGDPDCEVDDAKWFTVGQALEIMTYPSERAIIKKAGQFINEK